MLRYLILFLSVTAGAADVDTGPLPGDAMVVITGEANPQLPWTYGTVRTVTVKPGDRLRIPAGTYKHLVFWRLAGTATAPITIVNHGGRVVARNADTWGALTLHHCRHVRLTGTGHPDHRYGFLAGTTRDGAHTVQVLGDAGGIEIDHIEVDSAGFAGFNVKNEPTAAGTYNRGAYTMRGIHLHRNFVHDTTGEGFYIGHTFYNGVTINGTVCYPHLIEDLVVEHNHTLRTGCEGIQVGSTSRGLVVRRNLVELPGRDPFADYQDNGIQVGYSGGDIIGNRIVDSPASGIIVLTQGGNRIVSNVVIRSGGNGMFIDNRLPTAGSIAAGGIPMGAGYVILNNTIMDSGTAAASPGDANQAGIRLYARSTPTATVKNTLVIGGPGPAWAVTRLNSSVPMEVTRTVHSATGSDLGLADPAAGDLRPLPGSPLIDTGSALGDLADGTWTDADGLGRIQGPGVDVGAYEHPVHGAPHTTRPAVASPDRLVLP